MLSKILISYLLFFLTIISTALSQNFTVECGLDEAMEELKQSNPNYEDTEAELLDFTQKFLENKKNKQNQAQYIIPVVVHIVHENGLENIPAENVLDMMRILNEDYQRRQSDTAMAVPPFNSIIGKLDIEFRLATKDPNGNCTNGITRIFDPVFTNSGQGARPIVWPQDKYLNIWLVKNIGGGGIAAYSYFPSNNNPNDGVTCLYDGMGSLPPSNGNSDARRMPHEVGHYLNLRHPWGSNNSCGDPSNCNNDDGISDTPNTIGFCGGCNNSYTSCGTLDNSQNIMDYGNCEMMFTQGQMDWAEAALNSSVGQRNNLWTQSNLIATGTDSVSYANASCPPTADFIVDKTKECEGGSISFTNRSFHAFADQNTINYNWTFNGATPASSIIENPNITYNNAGIYDVSLSANLPGGISNTKSRSNLIEIAPGSGSFIAPFVERFSEPAWPNYPEVSLSWERIKPASSAFQFQRTLSAYYSPPSSVYLNNFSYGNSGEFELISPVADLTQLQSGSAYLNFQVAHAQRNTEIERLNLSVSTDCGESFSLIRILTGFFINSVPPSTSLFVPGDTSEWRFISQDISAYAGMDNVQFKFEFIANNGNNFWIDDIHISDSNQPISSTVGLRQDLFSDFSLYPNPNQGLFTLEFYASGNDNVEAKILDIIGKSYTVNFSESINKGWNSTTIDTRKYDLKPGIYFLKLKSGDQIYSKRLMIQ